VSASGVEDLVALRDEVQEIAREARHLPLDSTGSYAELNYSFGIVLSAEEKIVAIFDSIKQTLLMLAPVAHFETTIDGFTARTAINYSGYAASVWSSGTTASLVDAHLESLEGAYAFRAAAAAVVASVGNAVVAISIAVSNPLTVWHAVKSAEALKQAVNRLAAEVAANAQSQSA
jgi:hypothetical protein